jgi:[acyl-carrier-protein] S-malonyltransferase
MTGGFGVSFAVVFPGQGSQFAGMADAWATHPASRPVFDEASAALGRDLVAGCHDAAALATTRFVQPALLACGVAAFRVLETEGLGGADAPIAGVAGHSLGEFAAMVAAGAMELADALELVVARGVAMQRAGELRPGTMTAILGVGTDDAQALCDEVRGGDELVVANQNSPVQVVLSGSIPAIERVEALAKERRIRAVRLNVSGAFHSELMRPAVEPILEVLARIDLAAPRYPIAENVAGALVNGAAELRELVAMQVVAPVRWESGVLALAAAGATRFLEAGPGDVLTKLAKRVVPDATAVAVGSPVAAAEALAGT